ncbi:MAG: hypothetical protein MJ185_07400, partial [Treponema sp.]|nr:hypothetical protein [Treponema sp.]
MERKMKFFANLKKGILTASCVVAALLVSSCEIGLGAAVDTERPKIQITYPPKGAIIMDTFILAGTVSDDVGLNYLNVTLTNKDLKTTYSYSSKEGQVIYADPGKNWSKGTTWTASIGKKTEGQTLYNGWDLPDGEYFIDVEANDGYGVTSDRRSITIDNTPPVFIVENLVSMVGNSEEISVFGQKINLTGKAKDESEITKVHFTAYDKDKNQLVSSKLDYSMTSDGILLAQYNSTIPSDPLQRVLAENYNKIYFGSEGYQSFPAEITDSAKKEVYLTVQLSDSARKYQSPDYGNAGEGDSQVLGSGDGNLSTELYLNTQDFKVGGISIDELKEYRKHLSLDASMDSRLAELASSSIASVNASESFSGVGKLKINPEIKPKWYIDGFDKKDGADFTNAFIGSPITMYFEKGNNKEKFRPSNLSVVLARLKEIKDANDEGTKEFFTIASEEEIIAAAENENFENTDDVIVIVRKNEWSSDLVESLTKSIDLVDEKIHTPYSYRVFVFGNDGSDGKGESFEEKLPSNGGNRLYGFKAVKNTQPPKIKFLYNDNESLPKDNSWVGHGTSNIPFWFTVVTDGERLEEHPKVNVIVNGKTVYNNQTTYYFKLAGREESLPTDFEQDVFEEFVDEEKTKLKYTFNWILDRNNEMPDGVVDYPDGPVDWNGQFKFVISVSVKDQAGGEASESISFQLDNKKPLVSIKPVESPDMKKTGNKLNGEVEIPVSFVEDHAKATVIAGADIYYADWEVFEKGKTERLSYGKVENGKSFELDTKNLPANITLRILVTDDFENVGIAEKDYTVDQTTDKPKITFSNLVRNSVNGFGLSVNNAIEGSVEDDDGIKKIEVKIKKLSDENWLADWITVADKANGDDCDNWASWNFKSENAITEEGKYQIQFKVTDIAGVEGQCSTESDVYDILVDGTYPKFDDDYNKKLDPVNGEIKTGVLFKAGNGSLTEVEKKGNSYYIKEGDSSEISVRVKEDNLEGIYVNNNKLNALSTADGWVATYNFTPSGDSGETKIIFIAKDESGNTTEKQVSVFYDKDKPEIQAPEISPIYKIENKIPTVNGKIKIRGNVSDNEKVVKINWKIRNGGIECDSGEIENSTSYNLTIDTTDTVKQYSSGRSDFEITVTDRAGNTNTNTINFDIDQETDKPVITFEEKATYGIERENFISGSVEDDDGVGTITVSVVKGTEETDNSSQLPGTTVYTTEKGIKSFNCDLKKDLNITSSGTYVIRIDAEDDTDKTGLGNSNKANPIIRTIEVDGIAPKIINIKFEEIKNNEDQVTDEEIEITDSQVFINKARKLIFEVEELHLSTVMVGSKVYKAEDAGKANSGITKISENAYKIIYDYNPAAEGLNSLIITAVDAAKDQSSKEVKAFYDKNAPEIISPTINPTYSIVGNIITVNGKIDISPVSAKDNEDKVASIGASLKKGSEVIALQSVDEEAANYIETTNQRLSIKNFDTTALKTSDGKFYTGNISLFVTATDRSGNSKQEKFDIYVDQSTDLPKYTSSNATGSEAKENLFGNNDSEWIKGTAEDDDGVKDIQISLDGAAFASADGFPVAAGTEKASQVFDYSIPSGIEEGEHTLDVKVVDMYGVSNVINIPFAVDKDTPKVNIVSINGESYKDGIFLKKADFAIELEATDVNGIAKV